MRWIKFTVAGSTSWGILDSEQIIETRGEPFACWERTGRSYKLTDVKIEIPLIPRTFYCAGLNYVRHLKEAADKRGDVPSFRPAPRSATGHRMR
jgi:hypothetical protein